MQHTINENKLILEKVFNTSKDKIWNAFTDKDIFIKWWGPRGWSTEVKEFNFIENGVNHYGMKCEDESQGDWYGKYSWGKMVFSNINEMNSFEYSDYFSDENGVINEALPSAKMIQEFVEVDDGVKVISTIIYDTKEALNAVIDMGMIPGITETWDRLAELVEGE